jgi:hypothetical protein
MSHVLSPYAPSDDVVDAVARTFRSTRLSDLRSALRQCARIDWPASVRPRCLGVRFTQDHLRERKTMRRSAGRAPPRTGCVQPTHGGHAEGGFVVLRTGPTATIDRARPLQVPDSDRHEHQRNVRPIRLVYDGHVCVVIRGRSEYWRSTAVRLMLVNLRSSFQQRQQTSGAAQRCRILIQRQNEQFETHRCVARALDLER